MTRRRLWAEAAVATAIAAAAVLWGEIALKEKEAWLSRPPPPCPPECDAPGPSPGSQDKWPGQDNYVVNACSRRCGPRNGARDGSTANSDSVYHEAHDNWPGQLDYVPREHHYNISITTELPAVDTPSEPARRAAEDWPYLPVIAIMAAGMLVCFVRARMRNDKRAPFVE